MHSFDLPSGLRAHMNQDFSGYVAFTPNAHMEVKVPFDDLLLLVGARLRMVQCDLSEEGFPEEADFYGNAATAVELLRRHPDVVDQIKEGGK